jgi:protease-4
MRNFFASLFGALIGIFLALFLIFIIAVGMIHTAVKSIQEEHATISSSASVLEIRLSHEIKERSPERSFNFKLDDNEKVFTESSGLNDIILDIQHAATDNSIKGIFLNLSDVPSGIATIEDIRNALLKFKESHKFIIAYSSGYSQKSYYLASVADNVYLYPEGEIFMKGLSAQIMFYKKALDKLGIEVQVFRHGRYKSFVEPYILEKMSPDNKLQTRMLLTSVWDKMLSDIGASRNITVATLNDLIDNLTVHTAQLAKENKFVDDLLYPDEVMDKIKAKLSLPATKNISFIGLDDYRETFTPSEYQSGIPKTPLSKIAVIYAYGDIVQGNGNGDDIGSKRISEAIQQARLDVNVKAIVLRVNSPGGDALASDIIWREVDLAKKVKPVVVSMGDYAASGGYYIACDANEIVAEPNTITGSIGVFGLIPNAQGFLSDKLGITVDTVSTNTHAAAGSVLYPLMSSEAAVLQGGIENFYHTFLTRVADGRKLTTAQVDSIAQGRVWTGTQALQIGLVDTLGDMKMAIAIAAKKAHITAYNIEELPGMISPLRKLLSRFSGDDAESKILEKELGYIYEPVQEFSKAMQMKGVQARMPYQLIIE